MRRFLLCAAVFFFSVLPAVAQEGKTPSQDKDPFLTGQQERLRKNPKGLKFVLRLKGDKKTFMQGEAITVELLFSSTVPNTYQLDAARYDRSGRLHSDKWHINPADGATDPIREYFEMGPVFGGGLRSMPMLIERPHTITFDLNEWLRFDKPGTYRLYSTSYRINTETKDKEGVIKTNRCQPVTSNIVTFEIRKPDEKWLKETIEKSIAALDAPEKGDSHRKAARALRFLSTKEAVKKTVRRYGTTDYSFELGMGLIGSPHRKFVIQEMEKRLSAPDQIVDSFYIRVLSIMRLNRDYPKPPPYPIDGENKAAIEKWKKAYKEREEARGTIRNDLVVELSRSVEKKRGKARAICAKTLLESIVAGTRGPKLPPELIKKLPGMVASSFDDLPTHAQDNYLNYSWHLVKGPAMLPVVRRVYKDTSKYEAWLRSHALHRLYELVPDEGRKYILEEIKNPDSRISVDVLCLLPEKNLPDLDETLAIQLGNTRSMERAARLIQRYATKAILPRVDKAYNRKGKDSYWACNVEDAFLAYFLRVDPELGKNKLERIVEIRAAQKDCHWNVLTNVARLHPCPEIEPVAIAALDNANLDVVCDAASMLKEQGSARAEEALWKRFRKYHEKYKDKKEILDYHGFDHKHQGFRLRRLESALSSTLACSMAWLADKKKLKEIQKLCISADQSQQIGYHLHLWAEPVRVSLHLDTDSWGQISIAQYECKSLTLAKKKLAQFPKGTTFCWSPYFQPSRRDEFDVVFRDLKKYLEKLGMTLEKTK